jgi:hypothetical protein
LTLHQKAGPCFSALKAANFGGLLHCYDPKYQPNEVMIHPDRRAGGRWLRPARPPAGAVDAEIDQVGCDQAGARRRGLRAQHGVAEGRAGRIDRLMRRSSRTIGPPFPGRSGLAHPPYRGFRNSITSGYLTRGSILRLKRIKPHGRSARMNSRPRRTQFKSRYASRLTREDIRPTRGKTSCPRTANRRKKLPCPRTASR